MLPQVADHHGTKTIKLRKSQNWFEMASHFLADIIRQTSQLTSNEEEEEEEEEDSRGRRVFRIGMMGTRIVRGPGNYK